MKRVVLALTLCASLISSAFAQGGMGPGPGTVHSTGGGGGIWTLIANTITPQASALSNTSAAIDTTGANLIVISVSSSIAAVTLTDSKGNTWASDPTLDSGGGGAVGQHTTLYYCITPSVGSGHTFTVAGGNSLAMIQAFNDSSGTPSWDTPATNQNQQVTGGTLQTNSATPTNANSLMITGISDQHLTTISIDQSFTITDQAPLAAGLVFGGGMAYLIETSIAAKNPTWSGLAALASSGTVITTFAP